MLVKEARDALSTEIGLRSATDALARRSSRFGPRFPSAASVFFAAAAKPTQRRMVVVVVERGRSDTPSSGSPNIPRPAYESWCPKPEQVRQSWSPPDSRSRCESSRPEPAGGTATTFASFMRNAARPVPRSNVRAAASPPKRRRSSAPFPPASEKRRAARGGPQKRGGRGRPRGCPKK